MCGSALLAGGLQACSGDSNNGDAGPDGTSSDAAQDVVPGNDGSPMDSGGGCPTYTGSSAFCKALVSECNTCSLGSSVTSCVKANYASICEGEGTILSQAAQNAFVSCDNECGDAASACQQAALVDASLTSAQQKVVTDYCAKCGDGGSGCPSPTLHGFIAEFSDTIVNQIDQSCIPDASAQCGAALFCFLGVAQANAPPDPCADAGTD